MSDRLAGRRTTGTLGVISDTHGLLRPEAFAALKGCELIIHAGDVGDPQILQRLGQVAPVVAVRGNIDDGLWADALPETEQVEWNGLSFYVLHDLNQFERNLPNPPAQVVVTGHSHRPLVRREGGILFLNPGSAGPRRFRLPVSLARVRVEAGVVRPEVIELAVF